VVGQAVPTARPRLTNPTAPRMPPTQPTPDCPQCSGPSDLSAGGCVPSDRKTHPARRVQPAHDGGNRHPGQDQQMHVIGRHTPRIQLITTPAFSDLNRLHHASGSLRRTARTPSGVSSPRELGTAIADRPRHTVLTLITTSRHPAFAVPS
jgi:hypothetical protein